MSTATPEPRANCFVGLRYDTREAFNTFKAALRRRLGRMVSYDMAMKVLLAAYDSHGDTYDREELEKIV